jgi:hypothetical protein
MTILDFEQTIVYKSVLNSFIYIIARGRLNKNVVIALTAVKKY